MWRSRCVLWKARHREKLNSQSIQVLSWNSFCPLIYTHSAGGIAVARGLIIERECFGVRMQNGRDRSIAPPTKWFRNELLSLSLSLSFSLPLSLSLSLVSFSSLLLFRIRSISASLFLAVNLSLSRSLARLTSGSRPRSILAEITSSVSSVGAPKERLRVQPRRRKLCRNAPLVLARGR